MLTMLKVIKNRFEQGHRTSKYPEENINLYKRFRGLPIVNTNCDAAVVQQCGSLLLFSAIDYSAPGHRRRFSINSLRTLHHDKRLFAGVARHARVLHCFHLHSVGSIDTCVYGSLTRFM